MVCGAVTRLKRKSALEAGYFPRDVAEGSSPKKLL
jgi:hypothetical protein